MAKTETDGATTYFDGAWVEGSPSIARANSHALWMASTVFDGARAFDGVAPDLGSPLRPRDRIGRGDGAAPNMHGGRDRGAGVGRDSAISARDRALHLSDVLRREGLHRARPRKHPIRAGPLRGAVARGRRLQRVSVQLSPAGARHGADQRQGRVPLSQRRAGAPRGAREGFRFGRRSRSRSQRCRIRIHESVLGEGRRRRDARHQRNLSQRDHAPAGHRGSCATPALP